MFKSQDNNDDVWAYVTKPTLVITRLRMLHFTRHPSKETDDFDIILFHIY